VPGRTAAGQASPTPAPPARPGRRHLAAARHTLGNNPPREAPQRGAWSVTWAALSQQPTHVNLPGHAVWVGTMATFPGPDGHTLLAAGGGNSTVRIWDTGTGMAVGAPVIRRLRRATAGAP